MPAAELGSVNPSASALQVLALDHEQHRPGDVDDQRVGAVVDAPRGPRPRAVTGTGRASGSQRRIASVPVNASSAIRPSRPA